MPAKLILYILTAGLIVAGLVFPIVGGAGAVANRLSDVVAQDSAQLLEGEVPIISTCRHRRQPDRVDLHPAPVGRSRQSHRRHHEAGTRLDRRSPLRRAQRRGPAGVAHGSGGLLRGAVDTRGGSTIEQQYVKNYNFLVNASNEAERRAAIETTPVRKLREMRMALELDKALPKAEILTRYLNLVSFGNGSFGVQDAAKTYFGINAADLNWQQSALLAGMVQSTSTLNPYTNPEGALAQGISFSTP